MPETPVKQRSHAWRMKRMGMVTASRFGDVLTQPRAKKDREDGGMSATAKSYLRECLAEMIIGQPLDRFTSKATDWGNEWEAVARDEASEELQRRHGLSIELPEGKYSFCTHPDEEMIGCSPDGLVTDGDSLCEIKCGASGVTHLTTVLGGWMPKQHMPQTQGSLWITGRKSYYFVSFDPRYRGSPIDPLFMVHVERDDEYIEDTLAPAILAFRNELRAQYKAIVKKYETKVASPF